MLKIRPFQGIQAEKWWYIWQLWNFGVWVLFCKLACTISRSVIDPAQKCIYNFLCQHTDNCFFFCCTAKCYSGEMSDIPITLVKARLNRSYCKQEKWATCMPRIQVRSNSLWNTADFSPFPLRTSRLFSKWSWTTLPFFSQCEIGPKWKSSLAVTHNFRHWFVIQLNVMLYWRALRK